MLLVSSKYNRFFIVLLAFMLLIPCVVKRELKEWQNIETTQQNKTAKVLIACTTHSESSQKHEEQKTQDQKSPLDSHDWTDANPAFFITPLLPDYFTIHKEKVPTYLIQEEFLI